MSSGQILFADNCPDFLDTRAEFLMEADCRVLKAYTLEQARQLLAEAWVQIAILDIRMVNDDDERDTSGLTLAKDPAYRSIPKIILTGFPTYKAVREALGPGVDGLPPAVNFLSKQEGPDAMVQAVRRALEEHLGIKRDLQFTGGLEQPPLFRDLVSVLQPSLPTDLLAQREGELEDLFRRLFRDYEQIRIGQVLWHDGRRFCMPVLARSPQGAVKSWILVCGEAGALRLEAAQIAELAPTGEQHTKLVDTQETIHFGALLCRLGDADATVVQSLKSLIAEGDRRSGKAALLSLLRTIRAWHEQGQSTRQAKELMALYRQKVGMSQDSLLQSELKQRAAALVQAVRPMSSTEIEWNARTLTFRFPGQRPLVCPNPVAFAYQHPGWQSGALACKPSPGLLRIETVLVDTERRAWLSDFAQAGQALPWWDYVCLEAGVRFDLSRASDMLAFQEFEECLVAVTGLHDRLRIVDVAGELAGSVRLIQEIRQHAANETGSDVLPYYAGLLTWLVGAMAQYSPEALYTQAELTRGAHLLLAAAMIARHMDGLIGARGQIGFPESTETEKTMPGLILCEDEATVSIGCELSVHLSGQERELFRCLYGNAGHVVSRQVLVEVVFDEEYDSLDKYQQQRLNSLVRRLREKIEVFPGKSRYIHSVRDQGYRLETGTQDTG